MSWTDERVERLSKLWFAGRSASAIAAELGEGVTRNAVIGKIHRLGLADRSAALEANEAMAAQEAAAAQAAVALDAAAEPVLDEAMEDIVEVPALVHQPANDVALPVSDRVTIMELRETMCRWPLGDPTSAEFRFCGCRALEGVPYCSAHARLAFQPMADRRRVERVVRFA